MSRVIAVSNQKGGVGKTTTVVNLAAYAALADKRTLVVDNDPQGNASSVLGQGPFDRTIYSGAEPLETRQPGLWFLPGGVTLLDEEQRLTRSDRGRFALQAKLEPLRSRFDCILIDCPPNLSLLPINALLASDQLVLPLQSEYFALEGLSQLLAFVEELRTEVQAKVELYGILLTMHDPRHPIARQVEAEIRQHFPQQAFAATIPRDITLAAAPSHGQSILAYDPLSPGALAYLAAAKELLHGLERLEPRT